MDKKHLQITQKGFENYSGPLSVYEFKDGVSVEPIPRHERDRIAATMPCIEIAENGKEVIAGVSERLISESKTRAAVAQKLPTQTVEEKVAEERSRAEQAGGDLKTIYSEDELDAIIDEGGIAALRQVAQSWNVKNRSIPALRQMILDQQEEYLEEEGARVEKAKAAVETVVRQTTEANQNPKTIQEEVEDDDILAAAASGDMSAAVTEDEPPEALPIEGQGEVSAPMHQIVEPAEGAE